MNLLPVRAPRKALLGAAVPLVAVLGLGAGSVMSADAADPQAAMTGSPNPLTFDGVAVGSSADRTITLTSSGTAPVDVTDVANYGRDSSSYALTADTCTGQELAPGATCEVTVRFAPKEAKTLVTNVRFRSTNACTQFVNVAGGGAAPSAAFGAAKAAPTCEIVAGPTQTVTSPAQTVTSPAQTVTAPPRVVTAPGPVVTVTAPPSTVTSGAAPSVSPSTTTTTTTVSAAAAGVSASSPKVCRSRRTVVLNVKPKSGTTLAKVSARVNDRLVKVFKKPAGGKIAARLTLVGLPRTRVKVVLRSVTTSGQVAVRTQYFVTCVPKGR